MESSFIHPSPPLPRTTIAVSIIRLRKRSKGALSLAAQWRPVVTDLSLSRRFIIIPVRQPRKTVLGTLFRSAAKASREKSPESA